jgi:hypothetical protein
VKTVLQVHSQLELLLLIVEHAQINQALLQELMPAQDVLQVIMHQQELMQHQLLVPLVLQSLLVDIVQHALHQVHAQHVLQVFTHQPELQEHQPLALLVHKLVVQLVLLQLFVLQLLLDTSF